jgi:hypothetical protein
VLLPILLLSCCSKLSRQFRRDGANAYELLRLLETNAGVSEAEVQKAVATTRSDAHNPQELAAATIVSHYLRAVQTGRNSELGRRFLEVCRWESAARLGRSAPPLTRSAQPGDCDRLFWIDYQWLENEAECERSDTELAALLQRLNNLERNSPPWLVVVSQRDARQLIVSENCQNEADHQMPSLP